MLKHNQRVSSLRRGAMRLSDVAVLVAVGTVVLLISLPRLREFALRENEMDARTLVERLGRLVERSAQASSLPDIASLVQSDGGLIRQLDDAEFLDGGVLLRRHGYLFDLAVSSERAVVRAWPWHFRKTGTAAYAWCGEGGLVVDRNRDGAWSGPFGPPPVGEVEGWAGVEAE